MLYINENEFKSNIAKKSNLLEKKHKKLTKQASISVATLSTENNLFVLQIVEYLKKQKM